MNFDNLQDGQYVDITYRAGKTKKLITVKNLCFSCYFKNSHYTLFLLYQDNIFLYHLDGKIDISYLPH